MSITRVIQHGRDITSLFNKKLCSDAKKSLYTRCINFARLSALLRLVNLKVGNGWNDKTFTKLLNLLKHMLLEGNTLLNCNYEAMKILCPMGMEYNKIYTFPNDCILYTKEFNAIHQCPNYGESRYKKKDDDSNSVVSIKGPFVKVQWYLPIISRFKQLFYNVNDAKNLK
ncbi:hypothetical protein CR513_09118, partial [Mucuna pruriens]